MLSDLALEPAERANRAGDPRSSPTAPAGPPCHRSHPQDRQALRPRDGQERVCDALLW